VDDGQKRVLCWNDEVEHMFGEFVAVDAQEVLTVIAEASEGLR